MLKSIFAIVSVMVVFCGSVFAENDSTPLSFYSSPLTVTSLSDKNDIVIGKITRDAFLANDLGIDCNTKGKVTFPVKTANSQMVMCRVWLQMGASKDFLICTLLKGADVKLFGSWSRYREFFAIDSMRVDGEKFPRPSPLPEKK